MTKPRPFKPSWINRLYNWVERSPIPAPLFYLLLYPASLLMMEIAYWIDGPEGFGSILPSVFIDSIWLAYTPGYIHYLTRVAKKAMRDFRPSLEISDREYADLTLRFTNLPARTTLVISVVFFIMFFATSSATRDLSFTGPHTPLADLLYNFNNSISYIFLPLFVYFSVRQLVMVNQIYAQVKKINIFFLQPLYGFSKVTTQIAIAWLVTLSINLYAETQGTQSMGPQILLIASISFSILMLLMFILPLVGIRNRIQDEKEHALEENGRQVEVLHQKLYHSLGEDEFERVGGIEGGLNALFAMRDKIAKIPTWPWTPGTPRNFASAVLLPLFLWFVQQVLSSYF